MKHDGGEEEAGNGAEPVPEEPLEADSDGLDDCGPLDPLLAAWRDAEEARKRMATEYSRNRLDDRNEKVRDVSTRWARWVRAVQNVLAQFTRAGR